MFWNSKKLNLAFITFQKKNADKSMFGIKNHKLFVNERSEFEANINPSIVKIFLFFALIYLKIYW